MAKYYRLTSLARRQFATERSRLSRYTEAMGMILTADGAP